MLDGWRLNGQRRAHAHAAPRRGGAARCRCRCAAGGYQLGARRPRAVRARQRPAPTASCTRSWASAASTRPWWSAASAAMCSSRAARGRWRCVDPLHAGGAGEDVEGGPDGADAGQGDRAARRGRRQRRQGRAAAGARGDEDGAHHQRAARGTVKAFRCAPGDQVVDGADLVDFEADRDMTDTYASSRSARATACRTRSSWCRWPPSSS